MTPLEHGAKTEKIRINKCKMKNTVEAIRALKYIKSMLIF